MMIYWQLLSGIPGSKLKLTKIDDEIYQHFKEVFPEFDPAAPIIEDEMKSKAGKEKWRLFIGKYEDTIADYNFGTMLRIDPKTEYGEKETIFGMYSSYGCCRNSYISLVAVRMQFYAIEIARNRAGLNDWIYESEQKSTGVKP